jgi:outer membrane protein
MIMNKRIIIVLLTGLVIVIASMMANTYFFLYRTKVCYVRNQYVVENFDGMKDAHKAFDIKFKEQRNFLDSLQLLYKTAQMNYTATKDKITENKLRKAQSDLIQYNGYYKNITNEADQKMTEEVLGQVNEYIKEYGDKNGYDMIIGTTSSGNLLYATPKLDKSEELLHAINLLYRGKKM